MESIIHKIRFLYNEMGRAERKVADYILEAPSDIINLSVTDLAMRCGCGDATVVRFSRRLGLSGFQALKIAIASEVNSTSRVDSEIKRSDSCYDIFVKRINDIALTLHNTESVLDPEKLEKVAHKIMDSERIVIFGLGNSSAIARDVSHKLLRLGFNAQYSSDNHMQAIIASHLDSKSVVIGISHSGSSVDIVEAMQVAQSRKAFTVAITNYGESPILRYCDVSLFTKADETSRSILAMSSRIAQLAIFDALYTYIVVNSDKKAMEEIYKTEDALKNKKY